MLWFHIIVLLSRAKKWRQVADRENEGRDCKTVCRSNAIAKLFQGGPASNPIDENHHPPEMLTRDIRDVFKTGVSAVSMGSYQQGLEMT